MFGLVTNKKLKKELGTACSYMDSELEKRVSGLRHEDQCLSLEMEKMRFELSVKKPDVGEEVIGAKVVSVEVRFNDYDPFTTSGYWYYDVELFDSGKNATCNIMVRNNEWVKHLEEQYISKRKPVLNKEDAFYDLLLQSKKDMQLKGIASKYCFIDLPIEFHDWIMEYKPEWTCAQEKELPDMYCEMGIKMVVIKDGLTFLIRF